MDKKEGLLAARILKELQRTGREIEFRDIMIASICITNNIPLLTKNLKHFNRLKEHGLKLYEEKVE